MKVDSKVVECYEDSKTKYRSKWFIAYYLSKDYGNFYKYKPTKFKGSSKILVEGRILSEYQTSINMIKFKEYRDRVYISVG